MKTIKSIGAVLAGFLAVAVLSIATDKVLEVSGIFPSSTGGLFVTWMLVVAFAYRSLFTFLGGYITASLAPDRPMRHVAILGILGTLGGIVGVIAGWNLSDHWYPIALAVTAFPFVWIGGRMRNR